MKMKLTVLAACIAFAVTSLAHGGVYSYDIDGTRYEGLPWQLTVDGRTSIQRRWYMWPVEDPLSPNVTCNFNGSPAPTAIHAPIKAGGTITANWFNNFTWSDPTNLYFYCDPPSANQTCPTGATCDHRCLYTHWYHAKGPVLAYLAACNDDCSKADPATLKWFKIAESGLAENHTLSDAAGWPVQSSLVGNASVPDVGWSVQIPKGLKSGNYLIRHEIIMIELQPPQFYPDCAALSVTGEGTALPGADYLVSFPGAYQMSDPGLVIAGHMYDEVGRTTKNYTIPGPPVWEG